MSFRSLSLATAAVLALSAGAAQAQTTNGFANAGFETIGVTTPAAAWLAANAGYTRTADAHTGSFAAQLSANVQNTAAIVLQNSIEQGGLLPLTLGDMPVLTFWAKGFVGTTGDLNYALRFLNSTGTILAPIGNSNININGAINPNTWTQITRPALTVPAGAVAAFLEISLGIGPVGGTFLPGSVQIDDIYLGVTAVPEPSTYALMLAGLAGVVSIARRRRAAA